MTVKSWSSEKKNDGCGRQGRNDRNERLSLDWCEEEKRKEESREPLGGRALYKTRAVRSPYRRVPPFLFPWTVGADQGESTEKGTIIALTIWINISRLLWAI